jgi:hypothetical protein
MSAFIPFVPLAAAVLFGWQFWHFNRRRGWFSVGELIFWDVIALVLFQLVWLIWF